MKKKSLITMLTALTLVAAVGIGATLAYLSDSTDELKNTFTVGNGIGVTQDERDIDTDPTEEVPDPRTEEGNDYTDIQPGDLLTKDPTATVKANSSECYVFMKLAGADALTAKNFTFIGFDDTKWIKADGTDTLDGVYRYFETVKPYGEPQKLEPLFTNVQYSTEATETTDVQLNDVLIWTCAVQAKNMDKDSAYAATIWK